MPSLPTVDVLDGGAILMRSLFVLTMIGVACDDKPNASVDAAAASASASGRVIAEPISEGPGCLRSVLEGADADPACALARMPEDAMHDLSKRISVTVKPDAADVVAGSETQLRVVITNIAKTELLLVFDAHPTSPTPRPDLSRLSGVREEKAVDPAPRVRLEVVTLDADNRPVDNLPTLPSVASTPKLVGVRMRPGGKLSAVVRWWALRIPAPPPTFSDDAGHRYFPKTSAVVLSAGSYTAQVDIPFHGVDPFDRVYSAKVQVTPR